MRWNIVLILVCVLQVTAIGGYGAREGIFESERCFRGTSVSGN